MRRLVRAFGHAVQSAIDRSHSIVKANGFQNARLRTNSKSSGASTWFLAQWDFRLGKYPTRCVGPSAPGPAGSGKPARRIPNVHNRRPEACTLLLELDGGIYGVDFHGGGDGA